mgnify:CR=1 FL=1
MNDEQIFKMLLDCCFRMHTRLGPGLLVSAYETCLVFELKKSGLYVEKQKPMPLCYEGEILEVGYRIDLMVENRVIVEIKSVSDQLFFVFFEQYLASFVVNWHPIFNDRS